MCLCPPNPILLPISILQPYQSKQAIVRIENPARFEGYCHFPLFLTQSRANSFWKREERKVCYCAVWKQRGRGASLQSLGPFSISPSLPRLLPPSPSLSLSLSHLQRKEMLFIHKTKQENLYNYFWLSSIEMHSPGSISVLD